jgi:hypothetical protein
MTMQYPPQMYGYSQMNLGVSPGRYWTGVGRGGVPQSMPGRPPNAQHPSQMPSKAVPNGLPGR